jgi:multidrug efflux pump
MIAWLVSHRAPVMLVTFCLIVFGLITYVALPRESNPDVKIPVVMVSTPYVGVSPEDVEALITNPLENELSSLKDLKKMTSTSAEGVSVIALEFEPEVVIEDVLQRVRDRVSRVQEIPEDAEDTEIREISFSDFPILIITLAGPVDDVELKRHGEELEDELKRVPGVLEAKLSGGRTRQIRVQVDPTRLQHYKLSLDDVIGAIGNENVNIPGGNVGAGDANFLLRVPGEFEEPREIEGVAIKRIGDRPVFVRDVAQVVDGFTDRESYSRMDGEPAVSIAVSKRTGANILEVADAVKAVIDDQKGAWPEGVRYAVLGDQSKYVGDMVSELENNIITALLLVVGVIVFFMGVRNSLFVAVTIPLSMLLAMIVIWAAGLTLNMVVLFSLILALGMLVDNAIVLVENIYRHIEMGKDPVTASIDGTREIAMAVTASTLTTVGAFAPLLFWTGIMGQFMGYLPKTVVTVLMASLLVAVCLLPVFTARLLKGRANPDSAAPSAPGIPKKRSSLLAPYRAFLELALRRRYWVSMALFGLLIGTFVAYGALNHGTEFFPDVEPDQATISVRAPDGTDLEATDRIVRQIEAMLVDEPDIETFVSETGVSGGGDPLSGAQAASNQARITLDFLPHASKAHEGDTPRSEPSSNVIDRVRDRVQEIAGAEIVVEKQRMGPPVGKPIAVEVSGDDFHEVGALAAKVRRGIKEIAGTTDISDNYRVGRPEMRMRINRGAAKRVGASTQQVAGAIRTAVAGTKASTLRDGEDEHDIMVELAPRYRDDLQAVMALRIPGREDTSPDTFAVPLSTVASYELAGGSGSIRHIDQDLVVTIEGDVLEGMNQNAVREEVVRFLDAYETPAGFHLRLGGADDEQKNAQEFLGNAFLVAIFLIALVLVTQFNSFSTPLVILGSVVLSLIGVLWGLIITGTPFGILMTGIGVISLAGVVVNNAIVLLDYVEQLRRGGMPLHEALIEAGMTRFRPVMLTAVTTILGLVPMATGISIDFAQRRIILASQSADWWGPMAVAVIFGLLFATVLTLVAVPTMYHIVYDLRAGWTRFWQWVDGRWRRVPALRPERPADAE